LFLFLIFSFSFSFLFNLILFFSTLTGPPALAVRGDSGGECAARGDAPPSSSSSSSSGDEVMWMGEDGTFAGGGRISTEEPDEDGEGDFFFVGGVGERERERPTFLFCSFLHQISHFHQFSNNTPVSNNPPPFLLMLKTF
jgi:hypothetical protein